MFWLRLSQADVFNAESLFLMFFMKFFIVFDVVLTFSVTNCHCFNVFNDKFPIFKVFLHWTMTVFTQHNDATMNNFRLSSRSFRFCIFFILIVCHKTVFDGSHKFFLPVSSFPQSTNSLWCVAWQLINLSYSCGFNDKRSVDWKSIYS